ncbi:cytochrome P450 monooxygenase [Xylariales sp. PMI_506]|nr:cytochrome P450 monooxygenase [Xylariales sp. PMI_506]
MSIALVGPILCYYLYRRLLPKPIPGIPFDAKSAGRIMGNVPELVEWMEKGGLWATYIESLAERFQSPIVQLFVSPFSPPAIILFDFHESLDISLRRDKEFDRSSVTIEALEGVAYHHHINKLSSDPKFQDNRGLVRDLMVQSFLNDVSSPKIHSRAIKLVELWQKKSNMSQDRPFRADEDIIDATVDIMSAAAFGEAEGLNCMQHQLDHWTSPEATVSIPDDEEAPAEFSRADRHPLTKSQLEMSRFVGLAADGSPLWTKFYNWVVIHTPYWRKITSTRDMAIKVQINQALGRLSASADSPARSAVDHIVRREIRAAEKAERRPNVHRPEIYGELGGYLIAGSDTTSTVIMWTVKLLADHQQEQEQLRNHLYDIFSVARKENRYPSGPEIAAMSGKREARYLDAFIEEALRVSPPSNMTFRDARVDTTILGYPIRKGTLVGLCFGGSGYLAPGYSHKIKDTSRSESSLKSRALYGDWNSDDMHQFKPQRWLREIDGQENFDPRAGPFMTFGAGPRGCWGRRLAYLELRTILVMFVWSFQFLPIRAELNGKDAIENVTTVPKQCYVRLRNIT